jgi:acetolactate synthase-1/2/3 large subunit
MDIQRARISGGNVGSWPADSGAIQFAQRDAFLERLVSALEIAEKPLVLAGGGIRTSGAVEPFRYLVQSWQIPVVTSLLGKDAIAGTSPLAVGFIGSYGNRWANWAVAQSDLLLVLGSRLDVRQTGSDTDGFRSNRAIYHVDIDSTELNNHVPDCDVLVDDLSTFMDAAQQVSIPRRESWSDWLGIIQDQRTLWPDTSENQPRQGLNPNVLMKHIQSEWPNVSTFVTDVGQHQMWAAQSLIVQPAQRFLTSGGMGAMGFGLPAAIGAALAADGELVCLIAGDGGFQCNIQELQTLMRIHANVRIVVIDNGCHGMVRQFQEAYFGGRFHSTRWGYSAPDFCEIADAYGIPHSHAEDEESLKEALSGSAPTWGPYLIHVVIDGDVNAYPKMAFGQPFGSMEPTVLSVEMDGT